MPSAPAFDTWFGGAERWDLVEAVVGEIGGRVHLRWRLSVTNPQVGPGQPARRAAGLRRRRLRRTAPRRLPAVHRLPTGPAVTEIVWGGWADDVRDDPFPAFAEARRRCPVQRVDLPDGHACLARPRLRRRTPGIGRRTSLQGHDRRARPGSRRGRRRAPGPRVRPPHAGHGRCRPSSAARARGIGVPAVPGGRHASGRRATGRRAARRRWPPTDRTPSSTSGPVSPTRCPSRVICELLGVPAGDRSLLQEAFATLLRPWPSPPPPEAVAASDVVTGTLRTLVGHVNRSGPGREPRRRPRRCGARGRRFGGGDAVVAVPARRRRARHHQQPDRKRRGRPAGPSGPVAPRFTMHRC